MKRLFIGIPPDPESVDNLLTIQQVCKEKLTDFKGKWIPKANFHLTLRFLGSVGDSQEAKLLKCLDSLCAALAPHFNAGAIELLDSLLAFPTPRRANVLALGSQTPSPPLHHLHDKLSSQLKSLGFPLESRPYRPHITLLRLKMPKSLTLSAPTPTVQLPLSGMALYESTLLPEGAQYRIIQHFPLRS